MGSVFPLPVLPAETKESHVDGDLPRQPEAASLEEFDGKACSNKSSSLGGKEFDQHDKGYADILQEIDSHPSQSKLLMQVQ